MEMKCLETYGAAKNSAVKENKHDFTIVEVIASTSLGRAVAEGPTPPRAHWIGPLN